MDSSCIADLIRYPLLLRAKYKRSKASPGFNFIGYQDKVYGVPTVPQGNSFAKYVKLGCFLRSHLSAHSSNAPT